MCLRYSLLITMFFFSTAWSSLGPLDEFTQDWRENPVWFDGKAEVAVYDATRRIYGKIRHHTATLYTNREHANTQNFTKSRDNTGRPVFKHHLRENIPAGKYTYHYSTMCYIGVDDLKSLKIDLGSQEDCGTTFKQFINHLGTCSWRQSSYFPGEGFINGSYKTSKTFVFQDGLSFILRGYPFNEPQEIELDMLPDQTSNRLTSSSTRPRIITHIGLDHLDLPIGHQAAYHLVVLNTKNRTATDAIHYWFAADPKLLRVLVQYKGPKDITYKLRSLKRRTYWQ